MKLNYKKVVILSQILALLISTLQFYYVVAQDDFTQEGRSTQTRETGLSDSGSVISSSDFQDAILEPRYGISGTDVPVGSVFDEGASTLRTPDGAALFLNDFRGDSIDFSGSRIKIGSEEIFGGGEIKKIDGKIVVDKATTVKASGTAPIKLGSVQNFQAGDIAVSNGQNVVFESGILKVKEADGVIILKCGGGKILASGVKDSSFEVNPSKVSIESEKNTAYNIKDTKNNQDIKYQSTNTNNNFNIDCTRPKYTLKGVQLNVTKTISVGRITEQIIANNTASVEIDSAGIVGVEFIPQGVFNVFFEDHSKDFGLVVFENPHKIYFRKKPEYSFPECSECTKIDYINKTISFDGTVKYFRNWLDKNNKVISNELKPSFTLINGSARFTLDNEFRIVENAFIISCGELCELDASNYLEFYDVLIDGNLRRMFWMNKTLEPNEVSFNIFKKLSTNYSIDIVEFFKDNSAVLKRGENTITFLPPGHKEIKDIVDKILSGFGFSSLIAGISLFFIGRKKGQITFFIILGIIILIIIFSAGVLLKSKSPAPLSSDVSVHFSGCLENTARTSLFSFGRQGGHLPLPFNGFEPLNTSRISSVPTVAQVEEMLSSHATNTFKCDLSDYEKRGYGFEERSPPLINVEVHAEDVAFFLNYSLIASNGGMQSAINVPPEIFRYKVKDILEATRLAVASYATINGKDLINLEGINRGLNATFFPYKKELVSLFIDKNFWFDYVRK